MNLKNQDSHVSRRIDKTKREKIIFLSNQTKAVRLHPNWQDRGHKLPGHVVDIDVPEL